MITSEITIIHKIGHKTIIDQATLETTETVAEVTSEIMFYIKLKTYKTN